MKNNLKRFIHRNALVFTLTTLLVAALAGCERKPAEQAKTSAPPDNKPKVKMGIQASPAMALVMTAKELGAFDAEGVDVELVPFTAGKFALQALIGGSLNYCVSGEVPVALATLQGNRITVLAQVVKETVNECRVVVLRDDTVPKGAQAYFKAKKRKLATSMGGGPEFYTYSFLKRYEIPVSDVELISQKPEDMPAAITSGSVDAIAVFDPFVYMAEKRLGERGVTFTDASIYSELYILSVNPKQLSESPKTVEAVLRGLVRASVLMRQDPGKAKAAVAKHTKLDAATIDGVWGNFQFEVALTPKLLQFWSEQTEWARKTGKVQDGVLTPDYRSIIADDYLRRVKGESVTIPPKR